MVGVILSANRWTRLVANGPAGVLVDRIGTRKPFVAGLAIEGLATFGYVIAIESAMPELWFVIARVTWGIGSSLVFATAYTITADVSEASSRGTSMGIVRAGITFGFPAGMVLGGIVSEVYSNVAAFVPRGLLRRPREHYRLLHRPRDARRVGRLVDQPLGLRDDPPALTVGLVNFGLYFAYIGVLFSTLVLYLEVESLTLSLEFAGYGIDYGEQGTSGLLMAVSALGSGLHHLGREDQRRRRCSHARPARLPRDQLCRVRRAHGRTLVRGRHPRLRVDRRARAASAAR